MSHDPNTVPDAPSLNAELRKASGTTHYTHMEEAYLTFLARMKANGGKLIALTAAEAAHGVPEPPSVIEMLKTRAK